MDTKNYQLQLVEPSTTLLQKITEHSSYVAWSDFRPDSSNILYIHGLHGDINARSASTLFFQFQKYAPRPIIATFTFSERDVRTQNMSTFYASLCRQLLLHDSKLYPRVSSIIEALGTNRSFSHKIIRHVLLTLIKASMPRPVIIIIHGAQNCSSRLVADLIYLVDESRRSATGTLKLIMLDEQSNKRLFQHSHSCCIDLGNQDEHMSFLEAFAQEETNLVLKNNLQFKNHREKIFQILFSHPYGFNGIALTAKFMTLESESIPSTKRATANALQDLPTSPDSICSAILERCRRKCKLPFDSLVMWILNSVRPLTLGELAVATAISSSQDMNLQGLELEISSQIARDLQCLNGTLIKISDLQVLPTFTKFDRTTEEAKNEYNFIIFGECIDYLKMILDIAKLQKGELEKFHEIFCGPEYGFVEYAVVEWPQHYARTNKDSKQDRVKELFNDEDYIKTWFSFYKLYKSTSAGTFSQLDSLLKIACWFGFADLTEHLIQELLKKSGFEKELSESLDTAAVRGQEDIVVMLLDAGARSKNAMSLAANGGFMSIIQKLYEVDPNTIHDEELYGRTPLMMAILNEDEKMSSYLIERGAKCDIMMQNDTTPLHLAAGLGHTGIVHLLLEKNVDIQTLSAKGHNALHLAAAGGFDDISKILISAGVQINQKDDDGMMALHLAAKHGQSSTVDILLKAGAELDAITSDGYSPIHLAARGGFLSALRKLIQKQKGPALETSSKDSTAPTYSPLQLAAQYGHGEIVHELLQHEQYSLDKDCAISLLLAAKEGFVKIVEMLLRSSITIHVHDKDGNTALHLAANGEYTDIVERLVSYNSEKSEMFDTGARNTFGWTPLHFAAKSGRPVTLRILLDHGAEMSDRDNSDQTAFHIAASHGYISILRKLLNRPDSKEKSRLLISTPNSSGDTPFILAVRNGHLDVTKYILDTIPLERDQLSFYQRRKNALVEAVKSRHVNLVNLLLDYDWDINENKTTTALHCAVKAENHELIDLILSRGADPNVLDAKSQSPIHIAAQKYPQALETLLKERGGVKIDIDLQGKLGRTAIWQATRAGNQTAVEQLLRLSPDLEVKNSKGWTVLHAASGKPSKHLLTKLFLDAGANPMALSDDDKTPFMLAAEKRNGHLVMEHYINNEAKCDFNARDQGGKTVLHIAAKVGTLDTVKLLCSSKSSITAMTNEGATALHYAVHSGKLDIVEYLIKEGFDINSNSKSMGTPLMCAAEMKRVDAAKFLLDNGANVNSVDEEYRHQSALQTAASKGAEYMLQILLEAGANPNIFGGDYGSPLCASVKAGNVEIARHLLEAGADIDYSKGQMGTALEYAVVCNNSDFIKFLLEHKASVNIPSNGRYGTPLIAAIRKGSFDNAKILLEHGADANLSSPTGERPIKAALRKGSKDILNILLEKGAQLVFKDQWERGPLSTAILSKRFKLLPHLWEHPDVDFNERDSVGRTPLILAVLHGVDVIKGLQDHGADIDAQDNWGRTALIYAIILNNNAMVSELIMSNAALGLKDIRGRDALYWAAKKQSLSIEVLINMWHQNHCNENLQHAINAAIAHNDASFADSLLGLVDLNPFQTDDNGWTIHDTVARYKHQGMKYLIEEAAGKFKGTPLGKSMDSVKIPTQWHPLDLSPALKVSSDGTSLTVSENCM